MLAVDDDPDLRVWFESIFRGEFSVTTVGTIADAKGVLATLGFHVILVDNRLPDGLGSDLLRTLRTSPDYCCVDTPVIMLTAPSPSSNVMPASDHASVRHLQKPFSIHTLRQAVDLALAGS